MSVITKELNLKSGYINANKLIAIYLNDEKIWPINDAPSGTDDIYLEQFVLPLAAKSFVVVRN